jgi:membrane protease YdiL (CAAX protease family)
MQTPIEVTPPSVEQGNQPTLSKRLGFGMPFATGWLPGLIIGPLVYYVYRQIVGHLQAVVDPQILFAYDIPVYYGLPAILLIGALLLQRWLLPGMQLLGRFAWRHLLVGAGAVVVAYLASAGLSIGLGYGREFSMVVLGFGKNDAQYQLMVVALLVLPPIVEEIVFRHFLLGTLPFQRSRSFAAVAVVASAALFMYAHFAGYNYWPTHALMFTLGVIFAIARLQTGGLLLPITLHSLAVATALILNAIWAYLTRS